METRSAHPEANASSHTLGMFNLFVVTKGMLTLPINSLVT
jgi:hypothetical protein